MEYGNIIEIFADGYERTAALNCTGNIKKCSFFNCYLLTINCKLSTVNCSYERALSWILNRLFGNTKNG